MRRLLQPARELGPRTDAQLGVDVRQVARDRPLAQEERGGDLAVPAALGDENRDPALGRRQPFLAPAAADPPDLLPRSRDPGRGAESLEAVERRAQGLFGAALLPLAPPDRAEREQRPGAAVRIAEPLVPRYCLPEGRVGGGGFPARRGDEPPAACRMCQHPVASEPRRVLLPGVENGDGLVGPAELEQELDVIRAPPADARLAPRERSRL